MEKHQKSASLERQGKILSDPVSIMFTILLSFLMAILVIEPVNAFGGII